MGVATLYILVRVVVQVTQTCTKPIGCSHPWVLLRLERKCAAINRTLEYLSASDGCATRWFNGFLITNTCGLRYTVVSPIPSFALPHVGQEPYQLSTPRCKRYSPFHINMGMAAEHTNLIPTLNDEILVDSCSSFCLDVVGQTNSKPWRSPMELAPWFNSF